MKRPALVLLSALLPACASIPAYQPADSLTVGAFAYRVGYVVLQQGRFHCPDGQRRAIYVEPPTASAWAGCWSQDKNLIFIVLEDGEKIVADTAPRKDEGQPTGRQDGKRDA